MKPPIKEHQPPKTPEPTPRLEGIEGQIETLNRGVNEANEKIAYFHSEKEKEETRKKTLMDSREKLMKQLREMLGEKF